MLHAIDLAVTDLSVDEWDPQQQGWPALLPALHTGPNLRLLCASAGGETLGLLALEVRPLRRHAVQREALIRACAVRPEAGRLVGCALFEEALALARSAGCTRLRGLLCDSFTAADLLRLGGDPLLSELHGPGGRAQMRFVLPLDREPMRRAHVWFSDAV